MHVHDVRSLVVCIYVKLYKAKDDLISNTNMTLVIEFLMALLVLFELQVTYGL